MKGSQIRARYDRDGFVSPVPLISTTEANRHAGKLQGVESKFGSMHYESKVHTLLDFAAELACDPRILDAVEAILGPNILLFDVTNIVKDARTPAHVSWHQDLTYWGFASDEQVSMWLALTPATEQSGCMRMIPGSHKGGALNHKDLRDRHNVLFRGQTVEGVPESEALLCPLQPGEASFHHGWTLHASYPNQSDSRRIGLNAQYISPANRQLLNPVETAHLVRGEDNFGYYVPERIAQGVMDPMAREHHRGLDQQRKETWARAKTQ